MRTLIVSIYDGCIGGYSAAILEDDGELEEINIPRDCIEVFMEFPLGVTADDKIKADQIIKRYDHVIVCEDGKIRKVK